MSGNAGCLPRRKPRSWRESGRLLCRPLRRNEKGLNVENSNTVQLKDSEQIQEKRAAVLKCLACKISDADKYQALYLAGLQREAELLAVIDSIRRLVEGR